MLDIIFHHYDNSPFSEKIRLIFGAKGLAWKSVVVPSIMPKPDVVALTGGYRKTPFMQIGADIYCDTALIAAKIDQLAPQSPLYPAASAASSRAFAYCSDSLLFSYAVAVAFQPAALERAFAGAPEALKALVQDRVAMRKGGSSRRVSLGEALAGLTASLNDMETQLGDGRAFLMGEASTIADFSTYHPLWFVRRARVVADLFESHPAVVGWMQRMKALGHGTRSEMSSEEAIALARQSAPAAIDAASDLDKLPVGSQVEVMPTDHGIDPVAGELLLCNGDEIALRRSDERAGEVVVHFPRLTYELRPQAA